MRMHVIFVRLCVAVILLCPVVVITTIYFKADINTIDAGAMERSGRGKTR